MLLRYLFFACGAGLASCTVYAPMQPTVSAIRAAGQAEFSASVQPTVRLEAGAAYSPLPHVLLTGAGTFRLRSGSAPKYYYGTKQWEAGVGTYFPLGQNWLITALGGYGMAATERSEYDLFSNTSWFATETGYHKTFGQLGITHLSVDHAFGVIYRYTALSFDYLNTQDFYSNTTQAIPLDHSARHEVLLFMRHDLAWGVPGRWQFQEALGFSANADSQVPSDDTYLNSSARKVQFPALLLSVGVVFRPQLRGSQTK